MKFTTAQKNKWQQYLKWSGTVIAVVLFVWLLTRLNWKEAMQIVFNMPAWVIPAVIVVFFIGQVLNTLRWFILLKAQKIGISFGKTLQIVFCGLFASNFLPSTIGGDGLRFLAINPYTNDRALSLASILIDRFINVIATMFFSPFSFSVIKDIGIFAYEYPVQHFAFLVFLKDISKYLINGVKKVFSALNRWVNFPTYMAGAFLISWLSSAVIMAGVWILAQGLGFDVSLFHVWGISTITYFITLLPITISGYGLREITTTTLYVQLGAGLEQATALALLTRILATLVTMPALFWIGKLVPDEKKIRDLS